jgi:hypothetical protein
MDGNSSDCSTLKISCKYCGEKTPYADAVCARCHEKAAKATQDAKR